MKNLVLALTVIVGSGFLASTQDANAFAVARQNHMNVIGHMDGMIEKQKRIHAWACDLGNSDKPIKG